MPKHKKEKTLCKQFKIYFTDKNPVIRGSFYGDSINFAFIFSSSKIRLSADEITDDVLAKANLTRSLSWDIFNHSRSLFTNFTTRVSRPKEFLKYLFIQNILSLFTVTFVYSLRADWNWMVTHKGWECFSAFFTYFSRQLWRNCSLWNAEGIPRRLSEWGNL